MVDSEIQCASRLADLFDLSGQVAIVTGGSRGLGFQVAAALAEFGAHVVIVARKQAELDEAVAALRAEGYAASAIAADLGREGAAAALVAEVMRAHGRIDILVNSAGTTWGAPAEDYPDDGWNKVMQLNVTGLFTLIRAAANAAFLPAGRGSVLNIASVEGMSGHHPRMTGTIAYNAAKGAVVNLTRALAAEWGPRGIRVNAIAPGYFPSKMTAATLDTHRDYILSQTPLGKLGGPADLKGTALLLASDAGGHITGQIVVVDGGASVI
jgi:NAD(P)-dependent dehydrogenase (short-subunit alcohol dehydrogenase family)